MTPIQLNKHLHFESIESTNTYLKNINIEPGTWVTANEQTAGRGRNSNKWISTGIDKIIFSGKISFENMNLPITLFPLFVGSAILKTIFHFYPNLENEVTIKWPNDIYLKNKKICGTLVESDIIGDTMNIVIGIGLNIYGDKIPKELDKANFLLDNKPEEDFKSKFIYKMINFINNSAIILSDEISIQNEIKWTFQHSYLKDKKISTLVNSNILTGSVIGYTSFGFLLIEDQFKNRHEIMDTCPEFRILPEH